MRNACDNPRVTKRIRYNEIFQFESAFNAIYFALLRRRGFNGGMQI